MSRSVGRTLAGASTTRSAGRQTILCTDTNSSSPAPAFSRTSPSIWMRDCPRSSLCAGMALQTAARLPVISTVSPTATPSFSRSSGPMRAIPRPTSRLNASAILSFRAGTSTRSEAMIASSLHTLDFHHPLIAGDLHLLAAVAGRQQHFLAILLFTVRGHDGQQIVLLGDLYFFHADAGHLGHDRYMVFFLKEIHHGLAHLLHNGAPGFPV